MLLQVRTKIKLIPFPATGNSFPWGLGSINLSLFSPFLCNIGEQDAIAFNWSSWETQVYWVTSAMQWSIIKPILKYWKTHHKRPPINPGTSCFRFLFVNQCVISNGNQVKLSVKQTFKFKKDLIFWIFFLFYSEVDVKMALMTISLYFNLLTHFLIKNY